MAGQGPPPKHQSVRARSNTKSTRATLSEPAAAVVIPPLHKRYSEEEYQHDDCAGYSRTKIRKVLIPWHPQTIAWWNDLWPSPMASEWHSSDIHGLYELAQIKDNFWNTADLKAQTAAHAEIRLSQKDYGLTPMDRRRLEWTIESSEEAKAKGDKRRAQDSPMAPPADDEGLDPRLYIV